MIMMFTVLRSFFALRQAARDNDRGDHPEDADPGGRVLSMEKEVNGDGCLGSPQVEAA